MKFVFHFEAPPAGAVTSPGGRTTRLDLTRHDGLPALGHRDVLEDDTLRAAGAKPLHCSHPAGRSRPGPGRQGRNRLTLPKDQILAFGHGSRIAC
jgi:hypothetical protein